MALIIGCVLLLPGIGLLAGGGTVALGQAVATDDDGYFRFSLDRVEADGVAVAANDVWLDEAERDASPWVFDVLDVDLRLRADGVGPDDDLFVGIGRTDDVTAYLSGAAYSEVVDVVDRAPRYDVVEGDTTIDPPHEQDFWAASVRGTGEQQLDWEARGGDWSVVVMNADGSPGLAVDVELGARSGAVTPIAVTMIAAGVVLIVIAVGIIVLAVRSRRRALSPA